MLSKILIVHESPIISKIISTYIMAEFQDATIDTTSRSTEGLKQLRKNRYDVIVSGIEMAHPDGFELNRLKKNSKLNADTPVVLITSNLSDNQKIRIVREGIDHFLFAPFSGLELARVVEEALNPRAKRRYNRYVMPGAEAVIQFRGMTKTAIVINISLKGMLIELDYEDGFMAPWSPLSLDIIFPEDFHLNRVENITSVLVRQEAIERRPDHHPKTLRLAWMFLEMPVLAEDVLKTVLKRVDQDVSDTLKKLKGK